MIIYRNLTIIGTSHIAKESIVEVKKNINEQKPDIVALELDRLRFEALFYNKKRKTSLRDIFDIGIKGFLFNLIGAYVENKLGKMVNVKPGSEMKAAIFAAKENKADIALIDQDIRITLKSLSKAFGWKERFKFLADLIRNIFKREKINIDLTKVPDKALVKKLTGRIKKDYPSIYKALIEDRNKVMAKNLYKLMSTDKKIIAVVGAGHEDDIIDLMKKM